MNKKPIIGLFREEIESELTKLNIEKFRAKQIWHWLYTKGAKSFYDMKNISKSNQEILNQHFTINRLHIIKDLKSPDRTHKWLLKLQDNKEIETVFIPEFDRGSVCISSQVGCNMACKFCYTGTQKMVRNLTAEEILLQLMHVKDTYNEWQEKETPKLITNIVFMGMGEPLHNYKEVSKAIKIFMHNEGIGIGKRKITLSTCGIVPFMIKCGQELGVNLALSLHAPNDEIRNKIMPVNRKYPIKEIIDACRQYQTANNSRRITIEYVMIKHLNDQANHAMELIELLRGIPIKFNLIPFNPWPNSNFKPSNNTTIYNFAKILNNHGFSAPIRSTRGRDILAACGQLKSNSEKIANYETVNTYE